MLVCLSANHRSAGFSLLERLSSVPVTALEAVLRDAAGVAGAVVLSTCNRIELYLQVTDADAVDALFAPLSQASGIGEEELRGGMRVVGNEEVPAYLFAVSSGLESVVVGEAEIGGQVRRAYQHAREAGLTTSTLDELFRTAAETSKGVRATTDLTASGRSLVSLALDLAASQISDWSAAKVLLIGTGAYAGASLKALQERGVGTVSVYSPSQREHTLGERYRIVPVTRNEFNEVLATADVVVTCTSSDQYVIDFDLLRNTRLSSGSSTSKLIIDLGLPRNVDPLVGKLDGVDVLDLETLRLHAPMEQLDTADLARCIVARAALEFDEARAEQRVSDAIIRFRKHMSEQLEAEIARYAKSEETAIAMRKLGGALIHGPTMRAKQLAREGRAEEAEAALDLLFGEQAVCPAMPATTAAIQTLDSKQ